MRTRMTGRAEVMRMKMTCEGIYSTCEDTGVKPVLARAVRLFNDI